MADLLDRFQDLEEIVKIIEFETGKSRAQIASSVKRTRETFSRILNGKPSDKVVYTLRSKLIVLYGQDISRFVTKYSSLNSSALGHPRPTDPEAIAIALEELAQSVRGMQNSSLPKSRAVSGRTAVAAAGKVTKKNIGTNKDRSGTDQ